MHFSFQSLQPHPVVEQPHVRLRLLTLQGTFDLSTAAAVRAKRKRKDSGPKPPFLRSPSLVSLRPSDVLLTLSTCAAGRHRAHVGGREEQARRALADHAQQAAEEIRPGPLLAGNCRFLGCTASHTDQQIYPGLLMSLSRAPNPVLLLVHCASVHCLRCG